MSTKRPMATEAVFRPQFDEDSGEISVGTDTEPRSTPPSVTRMLSPIRRLGGG